MESCDKTGFVRPKWSATEVFVGFLSSYITGPVVQQDRSALEAAARDKDAEGGLACARLGMGGEAIWTPRFSEIQNVFRSQNI